MPSVCCLLHATLPERNLKVNVTHTLNWPELYIYRYMYGVHKTVLVSPMYF
jgi:hypothetical protein